MNQDSDINIDQTDNSKIQDPQNMFEERITLFWSGLSEVCDAEQVKVAMCLIVDPKIGHDSPLAFMRGNKYELAKLCAGVLRELKRDIAIDLDA